MSKVVRRAALAASVAVLIGHVASVAADGSDNSAGVKPLAHVSVRGRVVDPQGRPRPKARVVLRVLSQRMDRPPSTTRIDDILAETESDESGRFAFEAAPLNASQKRIVTFLELGGRAADVVAMADGFGMGWTPLYAFSTDDVTVVLQPAAALEGAVVDDSGAPVAGALVEIAGVRNSFKRDGFLEDPGNLDLSFSSIRRAATTDAAGRFHIAGPPEGRYLSVWARHSDFPHKFFIASTGGPAPLIDLANEDSVLKGVEIQTSPVRVALARGLRLVVRVVGHDGKPMAGGRVEISENVYYAVEGVDDDGAARLAVPSPGHYYLNYYTALETGAIFRLSRRIKVAEAKSDAPQAVDLRLPPLGVLRGQVIGKGSQLGLRDIKVSWQRKSARGKDVGYASSWASTDQDGRFQIPAASGAGHVHLEGDANGFFIIDHRAQNSIEEVPRYSWPVDVPDTGDRGPLRLEVGRGLVIQGRLVDSLRRPVGGTVVKAVQSRYLSPLQTTTDREGRFELAGLNPQADCNLTAVAESLTASYTIAGDKTHPLTEPRTAQAELVLEPAVTLVGRVLLEEKPLAGVRMTLARPTALDGLRWHAAANGVTDAEGRYRLGGLRPGDSYHIEVKPDFAAIDPGWHHQGPWVPRIEKTAAGYVELPDVKLRPMTQSLSGVVVDPSGRPVASAAVGAWLGETSSLFRTAFGPPPWTQTDQQGRFRLSLLPDVPLEIMAYVPPQGGSNEIRFPVRAKPELNQQNVRIVLDPSLVDKEK